jgi:hypothetical protein
LVIISIHIQCTIELSSHFDFRRFTRSANKQFKCIVFVSTCDSVDFHYSLFGRSFWPDDLPARKKFKPLMSKSPAPKKKTRSNLGSDDEDVVESEEEEDKPEPIDLNEGE